MQQKFIYSVILLAGGCATVSPPNYNKDNAAWDAVKKHGHFNSISCYQTDTQLRIEELLVNAQSLSRQTIEVSIQLDEARLAKDETLVLKLSDELKDLKSESTTAWSNYDKYLNNQSAQSPNHEDKLCTAYAFADYYRQQYINDSDYAYNVGTAFDIFGLLAGLTAVYGIADDNSGRVLGAGIALAAALSGRNYAQPNQRSSLYLEGAQRMTCITNTGDNVVSSQTSYDAVHELYNDAISSIDQILAVNQSDQLQAINYANELGEDAKTVIAVFNQIKRDQAQLRASLSQSLQVVNGLPNAVISATRQAENKLNLAYNTSSPSFDESLAIIQNVMTGHLSDQKNTEMVNALFARNGLDDDTSQSLSTRTNGEEKTGENEFLMIFDLVSRFQIKSETFNSTIVNYTDASAALKLCGAI